jgi:hypothetical protein
MSALGQKATWPGEEICPFTAKRGPPSGLPARPLRAKSGSLFTDELLCAATVIAFENYEIWLIRARFVSGDNHSFIASRAVGILARVYGIEQKLLVSSHRFARSTQ